MQDEKKEEQSKKESLFDEETIKWMVTISLTFIAGFLIYTNLFQTVSIENFKENLASEKAGFVEAFERLSVSPSICIVENVDNVRDPYRRNIFNCGVNLASTAPLFGKEVFAYSLEGELCYYEGGNTSLKECLNQIKEKGCFVFYLEKDDGKGIETYNNMLVMKVGETLREDDCRISSLQEEQNPLIEESTSLPLNSSISINISNNSKARED